jgi:hypothetical protein
MPRGGRREGAGRPRNSPNKATRDIKAAASEYTTEAIHELAKLAGLKRGTSGAESEQARISALKELLDRGHGRPQHSVDLSIAPRSVHHMTDEELEAIIASGSAEAEPFEKQSTEFNGHGPVNAGALQRGRR